jgi:hypothetical protein
VVAQLQEGLARLQEALSDGASEDAPAPPASERPQATYSLAQDPELVADFILESGEHPTSIEQRLLTLERSLMMRMPSTRSFADSTPSRVWPGSWS